MSGVTFERLPPERQSAAPVAAAAGYCCCCCCCCLHSVGSVIGAATAKSPTETGEQVPTAVVGRDVRVPSYSVAKEYWATVLVLSLVAFPIVLHIWTDGEWLEDGGGVVAIVYALVFPGIQLAASLVVGLRNMWSRRPGRYERLVHLGSITARTFVGGLIGFVLMLPLFGLL